MGAAISAGLLAAFFGVEWATGQIESVLAGTAKDHIPLHFRVNAVNSVLLGFLPTALYYLERWRRINHAELQPLLRSPVPLRQPSAALSHGAGVATAVVLVLGFLVVPYGMELFGSPDYWVFEHLWDWVTLPVLGWLTGVHLPLPDLTFHPARRVRLHSTDGRPVPIQIDGDPAGRLPADLEILPGAARLLGPS